MKRRTVFFVSDQTGITAETLGHSLLTQFENIDFKLLTVPFISTPDKAKEAARRVNLVAQVEGLKPIVFGTFVQPDLRKHFDQADCLFLDFFAYFLHPLEEALGVPSSHTSGRAHGMEDSGGYNRRIDAMNFALATDDGLGDDKYADADVILLGVSRSGKTPTCIYLALHYGIYAANFPLTEDDFDSPRLPGKLNAYKKKLFGLKISPERLQQIRDERRPDSRYASTKQIDYELRSADEIYQRHGIPSLDTTHSSVEEMAATILHMTGIERHDY